MRKWLYIMRLDTYTSRHWNRSSNGERL